MTPISVALRSMSRMLGLPRSELGEPINVNWMEPLTTATLIATWDEVNLLEKVSLRLDDRFSLLQLHLSGQHYRLGLTLCTLDLLLELHRVMLDEPRALVRLTHFHFEFGDLSGKLQVSRN